MSFKAMNILLLKPTNIAIQYKVSSITLINGALNGIKCHLNGINGSYNIINSRLIKKHCRLAKYNYRIKSCWNGINGSLK